MFSPNPTDGYVVSDDITEEIYRRFRVRCDWPERILPSRSYVLLFSSYLRSVLESARRVEA